MKDNIVAPIVPPTTEGNLARTVVENAERSPELTAFRRRTPTGWVGVSCAQFASDVADVAKGLIAAGVEVGDRVGLMARTSYEWTLVDYAIWTAGAVTVPVYETSSADQVEWILSDSGAVAAFVETAAHFATVTSERERLPQLHDLWQIDGGLAEVVAAGAQVSDADLEERRNATDRSSMATIVYTSGTTGRPKGCVLTHGNFKDLTDNTIEAFGEKILGEGASTLLFLPLAHVFARFIQVLCVESRVTMAHSSDIKTLMDDFAALQPTFFLAVPRVFEKIFNASEQRAAADGRGKIFTAAAETAIAFSEAQESGQPGMVLRTKHLVFDKLVYGKLRAAMGGKVTYAVSGGAPLGTRLGHFFKGIGVTILEGYGLTETTAPATVNTPSLIKVGTVGYPLPGVGIRIAEDGEIMISGVNVFHGYHGNEQATAEAIEDGWFHTGDIGELDSDGYLKITGRKKELIVTAGGKNVAPAVLEDRMRAHALISQCIVVGDQKPFIAALITLDEEMVPTWAKINGYDGLTFEGARTHEAVLAEVQKAVDYANEAVSHAEAVKKFQIIQGDFTEENGYLTPSLKLKRHMVMKDFSDQVDALYSAASGAR